MTRHHTLKLVLLAVTASALFELAMLLAKFPRYQTSPRTPPIELAKVGPIRIGAIRGRHGTSFVRLSPRETVVKRWNDIDALDVLRETREHLAAVPRKAFLEFTAYASLLAAGLLALAAARERLSALWLRAAVAAGFTAAAVLCLNASLHFGYGSSMYSTWVGPGAYSYSFTQQRVTFISGETVAQRSVLEALNLLPLLTLERIGRPLRFIDIWIEPPDSFAALLWHSVIFWVVTAFIITVGIGAILRRCGQERQVVPPN